MQIDAGRRGELLRAGDALCEELPGIGVLKRGGWRKMLYGIQMEDAGTKDAARRVRGDLFDGRDEVLIKVSGQSQCLLIAHVIPSTSTPTNLGRPLVT